MIFTCFRSLYSRHAAPPAERLASRPAPLCLPAAVLTVLAALLWLPGGADTARAAAPDEIDQALAAIRAVGPEGKGNAEAAAGWNTLSQADAGAILPLLQAMESSGPLARNWLRTAIEVIVERELQGTEELPVAALGEFLFDTRQSPQARRLAFDTIAKVDASAAETLVPGFLSDPATELRRDAVKRLLDQGRELLGADRKEAATLVYRQALNAARDVDQIQEAAKQLRETLEQEVDLPRHFGFLTHWHVIAPFDNTGREGFDTVFPPETEILLDAAYPGKDGQEIKWQPYASTDDYGKVDFNQPFGLLKEVTGFAYTEFLSEQARPAELRLGGKNAWKIWFNGELVFGRDEYHRGQRVDQYQMPVQLKEGVNAILVKACQDEQTQNWTVEWEFKLRVCDATGTAILAADRPLTPKAEAPRRRSGAE